MVNKSLVIGDYVATLSLVPFIRGGGAYTFLGFDLWGARRGDHSPQLHFEVTILNTCFQLEFYNVHHADCEPECSTLDNGTSLV